LKIEAYRYCTENFIPTSKKNTTSVHYKDHLTNNVQGNNVMRCEDPMKSTTALGE